VSEHVEDMPHSMANGEDRVSELGKAASPLTHILWRMAKVRKDLRSDAFVVMMWSAFPGMPTWSTPNAFVVRNQ